MVPDNDYKKAIEAQDPIVGLGDNLNLGCGFNKMLGFINVDAFDNCKPDVVWDLDKMPWPWGDMSIDHIFAAHILEHLEDWWGALKECARILKPGGTVHIRVPDESETSAGTYRDHKHVISVFSFYGLEDGVEALRNPDGWVRNVNAWAANEWHTVPLKIISYAQVPHKEYNWMVKWCPWLMRFCADHMRNFVHEQRIVMEKVGEKQNGRD